MFVFCTWQPRTQYAAPPQQRVCTKRGSNCQVLRRVHILVSAIRSTTPNHHDLKGFQFGAFIGNGQMLDVSCFRQEPSDETGDVVDVARRVGSATVISCPSHTAHTERPNGGRRVLALLSLSPISPRGRCYLLALMRKLQLEPCFAGLKLNVGSLCIRDPSSARAASSRRCSNLMRATTLCSARQLNTKACGSLCLRYLVWPLMPMWLMLQPVTAGPFTRSPDGAYAVSDGSVRGELLKAELSLRRPSTRPIQTPFHLPSPENPTILLICGHFLLFTPGRGVSSYSRNPPAVASLIPFLSFPCP